MRSNLIGEELIEICSDLYYPSSIAIDFNNNKLYWSEWYDIYARHGSAIIRCSNLDGSDLKTVVSIDTTNSFLNIAIDNLNAKLYWTDYYNKKCSRSDLDGSNIEVIIDSLDRSNGPLAIFVDDLGGRLFLSLINSKYQIQQSNTDGTDTQDITSEVNGFSSDMFLVRGSTSNNADLEELVHNIYPNPFSDHLFIDGKKEILKVELFDINGKKVFSERTLNCKNIFIESLDISTGTYCLKVYSKDEISFTKVLRVK